jgi:hypothetical protein
VADLERRAVMVLDPKGSGPARAVVRGVSPLSLAASNGRLALLDRGRHRVELRRLFDLRLLAAVHLAHSDEDTTLTLDSRGQLLP